MRLIIIVIAVFSALNILNATDSKLGINDKNTFELNPNVNEPLLKFNSTAPLEDIEGFVKSFESIKSKAILNPAKIQDLTGEISFKVKSLKTGIKTRDKHLYDEGWLHADKYPEIKFEIKTVKDVKVIKSSKGKAELSLVIVGDYKMKGKSKTVEVQAKMIYIKASDKTAKRAKGDIISIEGRFDIALKDFDVKGVRDIVGSKVGKVINIEFKLYYSSK